MLGSHPLFLALCLAFSPALAALCDPVTPACLQAQYGLPSSVPAQTASQIAIAGFDNGFAQQADLSQFLRNLRKDLPATTTFNLQTLDGGSNPQGPEHAGLLANLAVQYTVGVAGGVPVTFISVGKNTHDGISGILDLLDFLHGQDNPPKVLIIPYEFDEEVIPLSVATKVCNACMQLGARGVSIIVSSGDGGVAGMQSQDSCPQFRATFPATCPFVTSVGGTSITGNVEVAAGLSSGGFSNLFPTPAYQQEAVSKYLSLLGNTHAGKFNRTGRAFPDVAAQAHGIQIVSGGQTGLVDGSAAAAVIFGSAIALLNAELMQAGKAPLGFLNPLIYSLPSAFKDITEGSNPGCGTSGFPAHPGWDPVTGIGSPNYPVLKLELKQL